MKMKPIVWVEGQYASTTAHVESTTGAPFKVGLVSYRCLSRGDDTPYRYSAHVYFLGRTWARNCTTKELAMEMVEGTYEVFLQELLDDTLR